MYIQQMACGHTSSHSDIFYNLYFKSLETTRRFTSFLNPSVFSLNPSVLNGSWKPYKYTILCSPDNQERKAQRLPQNYVAEGLLTTKAFCDFVLGPIDALI